MSANQELIETFYSAFQNKDAEAMAACYHPDVVFSDPVFTRLQGKDAGDMWRMLCERGKDLEVTYSDVRADGEKGSAHWEATYTFSATGKKVHNVIDAEFELKDGKIVKHTDRFDLYRWTRMALGLKGVLLGWAPPVQGAIRKQGMGGLRAWQKKAAS